MLKFLRNLTRKQFVELKAPSGQREVMSREDYVSKVIEDRKTETHNGIGCSKLAPWEERVPDFDWIRWL